MDYAIVALAAGLLLIVIASATGTERRAGRLERKLDRVERKLDTVLAQLGVRVEQDTEFPRVRELLRRGKKIAAIKAYREATGAGLAEAKTAVERMED
ncbi:ribosomal protein L7/L12 [Saccharomonospora sp. NPDC006951]